MQLPLADSQSEWFGDGLRFSCTCCGNCCTGGPGFVWISEAEIARLADYLRLSVAQTIEKYCRRIDGRFSLKETRTVAGKYDCVFLKEIKVGLRSGEDKTIVQTQRICEIYPARPLQCRTWPFWKGNLQSPQAWQAQTRTCPGMNTGQLYQKRQIESLRDATDWPAEDSSA